MHTPLPAFFLILIRTYRLMTACMGVQSPCRFYPSCSEYADQVVRLHGARRGALMTIRRLVRCHPWNPGGIDLPETENP